MFSITSEYALRALVALAGTGAGTTMQARELASETKVPESYLYKILSTLRRLGVLEGSRGIRGGYSLARPAETIRLIDVVSQFEVVPPADQCLLGREGGCDDEDPCSAHDDWQRVRKVYEEFLTSRTIADLARGPRRPAE